MKCEKAQEIIALAVFGEMPDDQRPQLELHLAECEACRQELEAVEALAKAMSLLPVEEPSANLVARTRLRLEEALDTMPHGGWLLRFSQRFSQGMGRLRSAPLAASALLAAGLSVGGFGGFRMGEHTHEATQATFLRAAQNGDGMAQIANVSSIVQQPDTGNVEVSFNRLEPDTIQGSINDPQIRQLLLLGAQNRLNSGVRNDSIGLLADECRNGHQCDDGPIRNALMVSLRYDKSVSVRLKALEGLQPYVADDMRVRDAVLEALMKDPDPKVRTQAIALLEPVEADSSVREVLHTVAAQDDSPAIRDASRQVLNQSPQIQ
jgi:HEAT repeats/Putative zinc-finger